MVGINAREGPKTTVTRYRISAQRIRRVSVTSLRTAAVKGLATDVHQVTIIPGRVQWPTIEAQTAVVSIGVRGGRGEP